MRSKKIRKVNKRQVIMSIVGILLAMFAGSLLTLYLQAESEGYLTIPYLRIQTDRWAEGRIENIWLMVCDRYIPYWEMTIERAETVGWLRSSCRSFKTLWSAN